MADLALVYAKAFYDSLSVKVGADPSSIEKASLGFFTAARVIATDVEARRFLTAPEVPEAAKYAAVEGIMGKESEKIAVDFLKLLVRKRRIHATKRIAEELGKLVDDATGTVRVHVSSPFEMDKGQVAQFENSYSKKLGVKRVVVDVEIDPQLIAGPVVKIGSERVDASLKGKLLTLGAEMIR